MFSVMDGQITEGIQYVGFDSTSGSNMGAMAAGQAIGDILVMCAVNHTGSTVPSLPAGWTSVTTSAAAAPAVRIGYKIAIAASGGENSGNWSNATQTEVHAYSGATTVAYLATNNSTSSTANYPGASLGVTDGTSWVLCHGAATLLATGIDVNTPSGLVKRDATPAVSVLFDTGVGVATWSSTNQTLSASGVWRTIVLELKV